VAWPAPWAPDTLFTEAFDTVYLPGLTLFRSVQHHREADHLRRRLEVAERVGSRHAPEPTQAPWPLQSSLL
jgi:hypothetical protein